MTDREELSRPFRAMIVDDEDHGRQLLKKLADSIETIEIVGEAADGDQALKMIALLKPDVVYMDIKMPRRDGLSAAKLLIHSDTLVVFVTAFEQHALEAFEVQAFDYLLKPIDKDRFAAVSERLFRETRRRRLADIVHDTELGAAPTSQLGEKTLTRLKVRDGTRIQFIDPGNVIWFEAANQYVQIHARNGTFLISSESLNSLQQKLAPEIFVRVHRSAIVNINYTKTIRVDDKGAYFLEMSNGDRIRVSRSNRQNLKDMDI